MHIEEAMNSNNISILTIEYCNEYLLKLIFIHFYLSVFHSGVRLYWDEECTRIVAQTLYRSSDGGPLYLESTLKTKLVVKHKQPPKISSLVSPPTDRPNVLSLVSTCTDRPKVSSLVSPPTDRPNVSSLVSTCTERPNVSSLVSPPTVRPNVSSLVSTCTDRPNV